MLRKQDFVLELYSNALVELASKVVVVVVVVQASGFFIPIGSQPNVKFNNF